MCEEIKFEEAASRTRRRGRAAQGSNSPGKFASSEIPTAQVPYRASATPCGSSISSISFTSFLSFFPAFLIDTLPIRITPKSCDCIAGAHSNRHSSEPLNLHHIRATAPQLCNQSARRPADFLKAQSFALVQALCRESSRNQSFPQQTELRPSNPSVRRYSRKSAPIVYSFLRRGLPESRSFLLRATSKRFASAL
jgi:hypothetical protein